MEHVAIVTTGVSRGNGQVEPILFGINRILTKLAALNGINMTKHKQYTRSTSTMHSSSYSYKNKRQSGNQKSHSKREYFKSNATKAKEAIVEIQKENKRYKKRKTPNKYKMGDSIDIKRTQGEG